MPSRTASRFNKIAARLRGRPRAHAGHLLDEQPERLRFTVAIPGPGGEALFRIALEAHTEPGVLGGERLRMRAHLQANLASVVKPALAALAQKATARAQAFAALPAPGVAGGLKPASAFQPRGLADIGAALAPLRTAAGNWIAARMQAATHGLEPLLANDLQTWVEVHASSAPLDDGAKSLLPNAQGLARLGIIPVDGPDGTPLQAWSGQVGAESAQVMLLRLDERSLPDNMKAALGGKPFQLAAAVVSVATRR